MEHYVSCGDKSDHDTHPWHNRSGDYRCPGHGAGLGGKAWWDEWKGAFIPCNEGIVHDPHVWSFNNSLRACAGVRASEENMMMPERADVKRIMSHTGADIGPGNSEPVRDYDMAEEQRKPISERAWNKGVYRYEPDPNDPNIVHHAAERFLTACGLPLVPDAVDQLSDAFLPALRIICERGYHPQGNTWREAGWRGLLTDIKKKSNRLWYRSWIKGGYDSDSAMDLINFCGFYLRLGNQGKEWGSWGEPGSKTEVTFSALSKEEAEKAKQRIESYYGDTWNQ